MKKVLLIGKLTEVLSSINENLSEKYNVQLSSMQLDNIMGMVKIAKPDLIVICMIGTDRVDNSIFEWMNRYVEDIPVIIILSSRIYSSIITLKLSRVVSRWSVLIPILHLITTIVITMVSLVPSTTSGFIRQMTTRILK